MRTICFLSLLWCWWAGAQSGEVRIREASVAVDPHSQWREDRLSEHAFRTLARPYRVSIGYNEDTAVWCRIVLENTDTDHARAAWLCLDNNHLDSITLIDKTGRRLLGDRTRQVSPFLETQAFQLHLAPGEKREVVLRVKKIISFFEFSFGLRDPGELTHHTSVKLVVISFLMGIIFLLLMFNAILLVITRDRTYAFYIAYSVLSAAYILISSYYAKFVFFGSFVYFSELRVYTASIWLMSLLAFLYHYLGIRQTQPGKYAIIRWLNLANVGIIVSTLVLLGYGHYTYLKAGFLIGYGLFFIAIVITIWAAVSNLRRRPSDSVYVLLAFLPHFIWGLAIILKAFGLTERDLHEDVLIYICLYEVLLFGYVLARNYIAAFHRNNQLMRDIIFEKEKSLQATSLAQIRERRSIANLIHDNVGSKMAYILQLLERNNVADARQNMGELAVEIRDISHKILPKSLDDGALEAAIRSQADTWNRVLTDSRIEVYAFDFPDKLQESWIPDVYLIAVEIINNALKHGKARQVDIELYGYPDQYVLQFTDDGKGFEISTSRKGFGLENAAARIRSYGGVLEINSRPGDGTVVQIVLPR